jgi:hypothetical protein
LGLCKYQVVGFKKQLWQGKFINNWQGIWQLVNFVTRL